MGTHALIGFQRKDGLISVNVVGSDGYIFGSVNGAGGNLLDHYNTKKWAKFWAKHEFAISSMGATPETSDFRETPWPDTEKRLLTYDEFLDYAQNYGNSFSYLWVGGNTGHWMCYERMLRVKSDDYSNVERELLIAPLEKFHEEDFVAMVVSKHGKKNADIEFIRCDNNKSYIDCTDFNQYGFKYEMKIGRFGSKEAIVNPDLFPRLREVKEFLGSKGIYLDYELTHRDTDESFIVKVKLGVANLLLSHYSPEVIIEKP